jgi:hypothetical protein
VERLFDGMPTGSHDPLPTSPVWLRVAGALGIALMAAGLLYAVWIALGNLGRIGV